MQRSNGVGVGAVTGARSDSEEAGFWVDRIQAPIITKTHPADVVSDRLDLPTRNSGLEHGEVRLATGRGESRSNVVRTARRRGELEDEHVLGQPALVASHD